MLSLEASFGKHFLSFLFDNDIFFGLKTNKDLSNEFDLILCLIFNLSKIFFSKFKF